MFPDKPRADDLSNQASGLVLRRVRMAWKEKLIGNCAHRSETVIARRDRRSKRMEILSRKRPGIGRACLIKDPCRGVSQKYCSSTFCGEQFPWPLSVSSRSCEARSALPPSPFSMRMAGNGRSLAP